MKTNNQKMDLLQTKFNGYKNAILSDVIYQVFSPKVKEIKRDYLDRCSEAKMPEHIQYTLTQLNSMKAINKLCRVIVIELN